MSGRHAGKVAVVTGGARGIGRVYAQRLAAEGASVAVLDVTDSSSVVDEIQQAGGNAIAVRVDLTDGAGVQAAADEVRSSFGVTHILINNAGIYPNQMFEDQTIDDWHHMFEVNVDSMFHTVKAFLPGMKETGWGRIVNMTSNSVNLVIPGFAHYIASKMAVIGLTRALATELAEFGITANAVGPSLVRTASTEAGPEIFFEIVPQMQAIKRVQMPEDISGTISFLASDDAGFITGQTIWVDGGLVRS